MISITYLTCLWWSSSILSFTSHVFKGDTLGFTSRSSRAESCQQGQETRLRTPGPAFGGAICAVWQGASRAGMGLGEGSVTILRFYITCSILDSYVWCYMTFYMMFYMMLYIYIFMIRYVLMYKNVRQNLALENEVGSASPFCSNPTQLLSLWALKIPGFPSWWAGFPVGHGLWNQMFFFSCLRLFEEF